MSTDSSIWSGNNWCWNSAVSLLVHVQISSIFFSPARKVICIVTAIRTLFCRATKKNWFKQWIVLKYVAFWEYLFRLSACWKLPYFVLSRQLYFLLCSKFTCLVSATRLLLFRAVEEVNLSSCWPSLFCTVYVALFPALVQKFCTVSHGVLFGNLAHN